MSLAWASRGRAPVWCGHPDSRATGSFQRSRGRLGTHLAVAPSRTVLVGAGAQAAAPSVALTEGTEVLGTVVWAGPRGAKVRLCDNLVGFMPSREGPFVLRDGLDDRDQHQQEDRQEVCLPKGLTRNFRVISLPTPGSSGTPSSAGPLLSARLCDLDVLWRRAAQLCDASMQHKENVRVTLEGANNGGVFARLNGLSLFVPVSQLQKRANSSWWTEQDLKSQFVGKQANLAVLEVARASRKVVCSMLKAQENDELRQLEVGTLIAGTVRRIEPFGVFVGVNNTRVSGLLHISNVSRQHVDHLKGIFEVGEQVKCLVLGLDPSYTNISLSVAELEVEDGDVLHNKQRVWAHAEDQAVKFKEYLETLREEGYDFDRQEGS